MRISDWSSDVCSSDLDVLQRQQTAARGLVVAGAEGGVGLDQQVEGARRRRLGDVGAADAEAPGGDRRQRPLALRHPVDVGQPVEAVEHRRAEAGDLAAELDQAVQLRSEEHTSELQSLMRISYAVFCLKKKKT